MAVAGDLVQLATPAPNPDAALIEAERELMAIQAGFKALGTHQYAYTVVDPECPLISPQSGSAWQRFMELDRLIAGTPAETIEGAGVKLRRLDDSFVGLWMISETSWPGAVVNHHQRLLAGALGVLGRGYGEMTGERPAS